MTDKRKRYSADFKAKVALEALRGALTTAQLATKHGIHQTMVGEWKRQAREELTAVFADRSAAQGTAKSSEAEVEKLHAKIGQLLVERDLYEGFPVKGDGSFLVREQCRFFVPVTFSYSAGAQMRSGPAGGRRRQAAWS
jgi:transposase